MSPVQKVQYLALREEKEAGRCLLPDAPERKQRRKPSPPRVPCPLVPGTPTTPPPRKRRYWEVNEGASTSTDPVGVPVGGDAGLNMPWRSCTPPPIPEAEDVLVTPPPPPTGKGKGKGKLPPMNLQFSPSTGIKVIPVESEEALLDTDFHIVNTEIDLLGFTPTSSPGRARSAIVSSPTASTSSVPDEPSIFEAVEDQVAAWEREIAEMPGSDVEEDDDMEVGINIGPRQRIASEFPAEMEIYSPELQGHLSALDARDDSALRNLMFTTKFVNENHHKFKRNEHHFKAPLFTITKNIQHSSTTQRNKS